MKSSSSSSSSKRSSKKSRVEPVSTKSSEKRPRRYLSDDTESESESPTKQDDDETTRAEEEQHTISKKSTKKSRPTVTFVTDIDNEMSEREKTKKKIMRDRLDKSKKSTDLSSPVHPSSSRCRLSKNMSSQNKTFSRKIRSRNRVLVQLLMYRMLIATKYECIKTI